jgi:hypothetical protein
MGYFNRQIDSPDAMLEIAHRRAPGVSTFHLFGFNRSIETSYETVWNNGGGLYQFLSSASTLTLVSDSAADTMGIYISGLDENYQEVTDLVSLNGLTPVVSNQAFYRVNQVTIVSGENTGNITVTAGAVEQAYIEAGLGNAQGIIYTVPAGKSLYIYTAHFTSGTVNPNKYLFSRGCTVSSSGRVNRFWESTFATNISFDLTVPFRVPEKTDFTLEAKSSSSSNELSVYLGCVLMENDL